MPRPKPWLAPVTTALVAVGCWVVMSCLRRPSAGANGLGGIDPPRLADSSLLPTRLPAEQRDQFVPGAGRREIVVRPGLAMTGIPDDPRRQRAGCLGPDRVRQPTSSGFRCYGRAQFAHVSVDGGACLPDTRGPRDEVSLCAARIQLTAGSPLRHDGRTARHAVARLWF